MRAACFLLSPWRGKPTNLLLPPRWGKVGMGVMAHKLANAARPRVVTNNR